MRNGVSSGTHQRNGVYAGVFTFQHETVCCERVCWCVQGPRVRSARSRMFFLRRESLLRASGVTSMAAPSFSRSDSDWLGRNVSQLRHLLDYVYSILYKKSKAGKTACEKYKDRRSPRHFPKLFEKWTRAREATDRRQTDFGRGRTQGGNSCRVRVDLMAWN